MSAAAEKSSNDDKAAKKAARKEVLKKEAKALGISYQELKAQKKEKKNKKREADQLETDEHKTEMKRMRTWSKDLTEEDEASNKRRRTRAMDAAEEEEKVVSPEAWRLEHNITIRGHGSHGNAKEFADPFFKFTDAPFNGVIQKCFQQAGFEKPTSIQSQVSSSLIIDL